MVFFILMKPIQISLKLLTSFAVPVVLLAFSSACSSKSVKQAGTSSENAKVVPLVGTFQVNRYTLSNGLRLLVVEDHTSPTFAYQTWFRVGSRDEVPGKTGLAHLFEHMMFKETTHLKDGEFDRMLESAGAEGENAFTSRDYTAYVQEMPKDKLDLIARVEADRMHYLVVNEVAFKTELEVVQNERRFRNENSPDGLIYQELFDMAFTKHPYHWPVIGYQEDLNKMSPDYARNFYKTWYSPNHATIVVVGDVSPQAVFETVQKYYGSYSPEPTPPSEVVQEPAQTSARRKTLKLNMQVEKLMMGYHIPEISNSDTAALTVARTILVGGKSSRLNRALVETGIASSVDGYDLDDKDPSVLIFAANMQKDKQAAVAETVILREIARLTQELVNYRELARAKNSLAFQFYEAFDDNSEKAKFMGHYESISSSFETGIETFKKTQSVTAQEVQDVLKRWLDPKNRTVIVGVPK